MMLVSGASLDKVDRDSELYRQLSVFHERIAVKDPHTWGAQAKDEAIVRLNWVDLPSTSRDLLPILDALSAKFRSLQHVVLSGMGGSSLAPEVIARRYRKEIFILDSTDPQYIAHALEASLENTLVVVGSKSGSTIETTSHMALFEREFTQAHLDPADHMVIVTDSGSPLDAHARACGYSVINADPHVGGRFSALSAFALVPSALLGIDVSVLLDEAAECKDSFLRNPQPLLDAAFVLLTQTDQYIGFSDQGSHLLGLSNWIEQLIAESTGKEASGRLPVVTESVALSAMGQAVTVSFVEGADLVITGELGEHFIFWEWVTALIGACLALNPFNQPNVDEAKERTSELLNSWKNVPPYLQCDSEDEGVEIFGDGSTLRAALKNLVVNTDVDGYIAIMAYLDRQDDAKLAELRSLLSHASQRPVTFGWGPRFLHSTGQFHKGGQPNGSFLQITGATEAHFAIPGKEYDFGTLIMAQAIGDGLALSARKYPLLRLHLKNRSAGIEQLLKAARSL
jgi:glucose-6-phosphate isomerase